jgi:hypothetical protein
MSMNGSQIEQQFRAYQEECAKFEAGNNAAGTRARKALMEIKRLCDAERKRIQETKNSAAA